jgi:hypothetical protein
MLTEITKHSRHFAATNETRGIDCPSRFARQQNTRQKGARRPKAQAGKAHTERKRERETDVSPWTSTLLPGSTRPEFGRTQYCFGAVVFTLKAIGCAFGLRTVRVRLTSVVSGPERKPKLSGEDTQRPQNALTGKPQGRMRLEFDAHCNGRRGKGSGRAV